jgi:ATP-dependent RNA helicase DDX3X
VKVLLESNQQIPDFLSDKKPEEGETLTFDDDSEEEEENEDGAAAGGAGNAWGAGGGDAWGANGDATSMVAAAAAPAPEATVDWNASASNDW